MGGALVVEGGSQFLKLIASRFDEFTPVDILPALFSAITNSDRGSPPNKPLPFMPKVFPHMIVDISEVKELPFLHVQIRVLGEAFSVMPSAT